MVGWWYDEMILSLVVATQWILWSGLLLVLVHSGFSHFNCVVTLQHGDLSEVSCFHFSQEKRKVYFQMLFDFLLKLAGFSGRRSDVLNLWSSVELTVVKWCWLMIASIQLECLQKTRFIRKIHFLFNVRCQSNVIVLWFAQKIIRSFNFLRCIGLITGLL